MKDNISKLKDCYGCGVCVAACPVKIISLRENASGYYTPCIDEQQSCIECGLCLKVCAFNHSNTALSTSSIESYASWSKNDDIRKNCSSGGIGFEIGSHLIRRGFNVIGVKYDTASRRALHFISNNTEDFKLTRTSKYIPSFTADALLNIDRKQKYLFTGTPCQVDSMRRFIRQFKIENNFILMDFFCHGVPSLLMWDKYVSFLETKVNPLGYVSWRNKRSGWHNSWEMCAFTSNRGGEHPAFACKKDNGDLFYKFFLDNYCLNKCCYKSCKYKKLKSSADIRIGDLFAKEYADNQEGVSGVIAITEKGKTIINQLKDSCTFTSKPATVVMAGQMAKAPKMPRIYEKTISALSSNASLSDIYNTIIRRYRRTRLPQRILNRIKRLLTNH